MLIEKLNEVRDKKLKRNFEVDFKKKQAHELKFLNLLFFWFA